VFVCHFHYQLRTQRLPGEILALAPAALAAGHALVRLSRGPELPRMIHKRVLAVRFEELRKLAALRIGEAGADTDVLQRSGAIEEAEQ